MLVSTIVSYIIVSGIIALVGYKIYVFICDLILIAKVTPLNRGEWSERQAILPLLKLGIDPRAIFHDLYIRKENGTYTQVDLAVATKSGLIVIEVKDYGGWIFGNERQKYWTQIMAYGREKNRFYNPILQNAGHINAIRESLPQNPDIPIYSVIVFYGRCELKDITYFSQNMYLIYPEEIASTVQSILDREPANFGNKHEVMEVLTQAVQDGADPEIREAHLSAVQYYARNTPSSSYRYSYFPRFRFPTFRRRFW